MLKDEFDCTFFTVAPTDFQRCEIGKVCQLEELSDDKSKFESFLQRLSGNEIVFVDDYSFTPENEKAVKDKGCKLVVLSPSKPHHYADVVINYVDKVRSHYSVEEYTKIVAGLEWAILREPFRRPVDNSKRKKGKVVISFGGTDQYFLTEKVIDLLVQELWQMIVICTSCVTEERRIAWKKKGVEVYTDIPSEEVASLFEQTEFAILSSSTVCLEALSRCAKVLAGYYVDNQVNFYRVLMNEQCIIGLGDLLLDNCFTNLGEKMKEASTKDRLHIDFTNQKERYVSLFNNLC
jgi:spore coat polysaccharide biosynthesis predicted glycosyltransferase SpsG